MRNQKKIVIYPLSQTNPYQSLLSNALRELGQIVDLEPAVSKTLPFHLLKSSCGAKILHLHWIAGLYEGKTKLRFIARTIFFLLTIVILRFKGVRVGLTLHNIVPHNKQNRNYHLWARRLILSFSNFIIVHSEAAREEASRYFGQYETIAVVPHGHYRGYYPNGVSRDKARKVLNIPESAKLMLFLGGLQPYKGIEDFMGLFKKLEAENLFFLVAGPGQEEYVKFLEKRLPKNCMLHSSYVPDKNVQYYMNASDCMVLPYTESLTSGAAVLGLSFYLPILATKTVALQHLVQEKLAVFYDPRKLESLRMGIEEILSWNARSFKERCDKFLGFCSWDLVGQRHLEVFGLSPKSD